MKKMGSYHELLNINWDVSKGKKEEVVSLKKTLKNYWDTLFLRAKYSVTTARARARKASSPRSGKTSA